MTALLIDGMGRQRQRLMDVPDGLDVVRLPIATPMMPQWQPSCEVLVPNCPITFHRFRRTGELALHGRDGLAIAPIYRLETPR